MTTALNQLSGDHVARATIEAQGTAGSADSWTVFTAPGTVTITGVTWTPNAAVTGAATNNFALAVQNKGTDGTGTTAVTTTKTYASGTDSVAHAPEAFTLSATAADLVVSPGEAVVLVRTTNGTGLASPDGQCEVTYRYAG